MVNQQNGETAIEVKTPDWLDATFVQGALRRGGETKLQVKQMTVRVATAAGDNYCSTMYRVKATTVDGKEHCLIIKVAPPGEEMLNLIHESKFFHVESIMLERVLPEMEALLKAAAPGRFPPLTARCLQHGTTPMDYLVLEDLGPQGFQMADRHQGLGLRHCLLALKTLARFHAATAALLQRDPKALQEAPNAFKEKHRAFDVFTVGSLKATANGCRQWAGFDEYADCLEALQPVIMKKFGELNDPKPGGFNVIIHGDFWTNNMLFRYEDGVPQELRLVDLQISHVAPAALDLLYFFSTSVSEAVSKHHQDLLLREYHLALKETMELLGLEPPTLETILADIDSQGAYSLFGALGVLPIVKAQNPPNMNTVLSGDNTEALPLYEDPAVKRWLQRLLPYYKRRGWLSP